MRWHTPMMVLMVGLLIASGPQDDAAKKELSTFQGTWLLISVEKDGKKVEEKGIKLRIMGNKYTLTQESSAVLGHKGTHTLDPAKKPKETDVTVTEGPDKGKTFLGIYELSSDDYKVCFAPAGKERPKEFSAKPGSGNLLQIWKRERK